jgi:hypothetical protein
MQLVFQKFPADKFKGRDAIGLPFRVLIIIMDN